MTRYLLDVNVVVALIDENHVHHTSARRWAQHDPDGTWLLCPIVENAVLRIFSTPTYTGVLGSVVAALRLLERFRAMPRCAFHPDGISFVGEAIPLAHPDRITARHVTDLYLLGLARAAGARLATFDRRIPVDATRIAADHLEIIPVLDG